MIAERLSDIRKDHGNTQADLAKLLGVSLPTIRAWEQGKSSPSHDMLVCICKLYHISSDYLLGLSNIDPAYVRHTQVEKLSQDELISLAQYEEFLVWKRKNKS